MWFAVTPSDGVFYFLTSAIQRTINGTLPTPISSLSAAFSDPFAPPLPPLPSKDLPTPTTDVFGDVGTPSIPSPNLLKPLPDIRSGRPPTRISQESDSNSIVVVNMPGKDDSPMTTPVAKEFKDISTTSSKHTKRRSMSVSDVDVKRTLAQNSPMPPRLKELERTSNGMGKFTQRYVLRGVFGNRFFTFIARPGYSHQNVFPTKRAKLQPFLQTCKTRRSPIALSIRQHRYPPIPRL
jgi:hypothetical protein